MEVTSTESCTENYPDLKPYSRIFPLPNWFNYPSLLFTAAATAAVVFITVTGFSGTKTLIKFRTLCPLRPPVVVVLDPYTTPPPAATNRIKPIPICFQLLSTDEHTHSTVQHSAQSSQVQANLSSRLGRHNNALVLEDTIAPRPSP